MDKITRLIYTLEYYLTRKEENFTFVTAWMDLENIMVSEISQSEKNKCHRLSLMGNLINKLN